MFLDSRQPALGADGFAKRIRGRHQSGSSAKDARRHSSVDEQISAIGRHE
jgi:hypothetical protein